MGAVAYDAVAVERICGRLRRIVQDAFQRHLYGTAIFYADKLVSLNPDDVEDLYTLAECYFHNREYRRVLHLLRRCAKVADGDGRLALLAAQSLLECKEWKSCLQYLEDHSPTWECSSGADGAPTPGAPAGQGPDSGNSRLASAFAFIRGRVHEAMENRESALDWYERAVQLDPYCHEALDRLVGSHLLPLDREKTLVLGLAFHEEDEWLRHSYAARLPSARVGADGQVPQVSGAEPTPESGCADVAAAPPPAATAGAAVAAAVCEPGGPAAGQWWQRQQGRKRRQRQAVAGGEDVPPGAGEYPAPMLPAPLVRNSQTLSSQSTKYFYEGDYESCYQVSKRVLDEDPFNLDVMGVHIASLVMQDRRERKSDVFYAAHQLINAYPGTAVSWFTAGCYYFMARMYENARRFFHKALAIDYNFAPAWIAYGHAFANHDESDQALAAYRTASRLFPGSHLPWLFIGMEYVRTNSLHLAQQCLECSRLLMPGDPHVFNELGVVAFQRRNYEAACDLLLQALKLSTAPHDVSCANLGHAFLKCKAYDRALAAFKQAHRLNPQSLIALSGIAFSLQLLGRPEQAVEHYFKALSVDRDDAFSAEMLSMAVQEADRPSTMEL